MDLYYTLPSAPCRGVLMVAKALQLELNLKPVSLKAKEQMRPEFLALNPTHTVPTLVDGDFVLWESKAIIVFLLEVYGKDSSLYPSEPKTRAQINRLLFFDMGMHEAFRSWAHPVLREGKPCDETKLAQLHVKLAQLDDELRQRNKRFVLSDSICVADLTLTCAVTTYRELGVDMSRHPHVEEWLRNCEQDMSGYREICLEGAKQMATHAKPLLTKSEGSV